MFPKNSQIALVTLAIVALAAQSALCAPTLSFGEYEQSMTAQATEVTSNLHAQVNSLISQSTQEYNQKRTEIIS